MSLADLTVIKKILQKHQLWAKKQFGQNFLISDKSLEKIVNAANLTSTDHVIEIGPGLGVLTYELAKRTEKVTSIELDKSLLPVLEDTLSDYSNVEIIHADALRWDPPAKKYKLVANIPYYITSPLINHFLQNENKPQTITLLVQKEVAQKICSLTPDMSVLSLQVALFGKAELISIIPNSHFYPAPKVDSAVLHIKVAQEGDPDYIPKKTALQILSLAKRAFLSGRKKLSNTLPDLKEKLIALNIEDKRPQHLTIDEWKALIS